MTDECMSKYALGRGGGGGEGVVGGCSLRQIFKIMLSEIFSEAIFGPNATKLSHL